MHKKWVIEKHADFFSADQMNVTSILLHKSKRHFQEIALNIINYFKKWLTMQAFIKAFTLGLEKTNLNVLAFWFDYLSLWKAVTKNLYVTFHKLHCVATSLLQSPSKWEPHLFNGCHKMLFSANNSFKLFSASSRHAAIAKDNMLL